MLGGINAYGYAYQNPLGYVDPEGLWAHVLVGGAVGAVFNAATYALTTDNFTLGGFAREALIGGFVGAATAAVPGAIAMRKLNFGRYGNPLASFGAAVSAGALGNLGSQWNQKGRCESIDVNDALWAGVANAVGLGVGRFFQEPARRLSTTTVPAVKRFPVTSLNGNQRHVINRPRVEFITVKLYSKLYKIQVVQQFQ